MNVLLNLSVLFGIGLAAAIFAFLLSVFIERSSNIFSDFIRHHFG